MRLLRIEKSVDIARETEPEWDFHGDALRAEVQRGRFSADFILTHFERIGRALTYLGPRAPGEPQRTDDLAWPVDNDFGMKLLFDPRPVRALVDSFLAEREAMGTERDKEGQSVTPMGDLFYNARFAISALIAGVRSPAVPLGEDEDELGRGRALLRGVQKILPVLDENSRCRRTLGIHRYKGVTEDDEVALFARILHHPEATPAVMAFLQALQDHEMLDWILAAPVPPPEPEPGWITDAQLAEEARKETWES